MNRYPRDFRGYGPDAPRVRWPGGAPVAVSLVLNYEEGGESCLLHGDTCSESFLSEIVGAQSWQGQRHWNMESIYGYGARAGFWRLHHMMRDLPVTVYGVATALARSPEQVAAMQDADWEIASHGLKWVEHRDMSEVEERRQIAAAVRLHTEVTGSRPTGWYTGRCSMNTLRLAAEQGFDWISDAYDDDLPYWIQSGIRHQLVIPYSLDTNDMRCVTAQGFSTGEHFFRYLSDTLDCLIAEGEGGRQKMMSVGLHCRIMGRPGRAGGLLRFIREARARGAWFATRAEIAAHWRASHPPESREQPSIMDRATFVACFGGIFEGSPWIAERTHELELGPAHDSVVGLFSALARTFRTASDGERLDVLRAHPDLAGKIAQARQLSADSAAEQASAGLDALTDRERATLAQLNLEYSGKHGFPFIIAVRENSKESILAALRARISNDTATEFATACQQVERIALLRLKAMLP